MTKEKTRHMDGPTHHERPGQPPTPTAPKAPETSSNKLAVLYIMRDREQDESMRRLNESAFQPDDIVTNVLGLDQARQELQQRVEEGKPPFDVVISPYRFGYAPDDQTGMEFAREIRNTSEFGHPVFVIRTAEMTRLNMDYPKGLRRQMGVDMEIEGLLQQANLTEIRAKVKGKLMALPHP